MPTSKKNQGGSSEGGRARLTGKQRAFVEAYVGEARGNATEAARIAGYSDPHTSGNQNTRKYHILDAIEELRKEVIASDPSRLSVDDIHDYWARMVRDPGVSDTVKATILRDAARAAGMFIDRVEAEHRGSVRLKVRLPNTGSGHD